MSSKILDAFIAYQFVKILSTPWEETKAYTLGIIDDKGNILRKRRDLKTSQEKNSYTLVHRLIWNIKKLLDKLPPTRTRIGSFGAALWMLKEHHEVIDGADFSMAERAFIKYLSEHTDFNQNVLMEAIEVETPILEKGVYIIKTAAIDGPEGRTVAGDRIIVMNDQEAEGVIAGTHIFLVMNSRTKEPLYISKEDIVEEI